MNGYLVLIANQSLSFMCIHYISYVISDHPEVQPEDYMPDHRYNHLQQVTERLKFLRFVLKDGHLWLCSPQAVQIWECLAINAVYPSDREACFKWFTKVGFIRCRAPSFMFLFL